VIPVAWDPRLSSHPCPQEPTDLLRHNLLFQGDNLTCLQALADTHSGQVQCAYLDPPYNTGATWEHYGDREASDTWQAFMAQRLEALRPLMCEDGLVFVQIDDCEHAYLQLVMDRVFGRHRRLCTIVVKMSELSGVKMSHVDRKPPKLKEYLLVYGMSDNAVLRPVRVLKARGKLERYLRYYTKVIENPTDPVAQWRVVPIRHAMAEEGLADSAEARQTWQLANRDRVVYRTNNRFLASLQFEDAHAIRRVRSPTGIEYVWWDGRQMLFLADHVEEVLGDLWTDISTINLGREGGVRFRNGKKPEALLRRVLQMSTRPGDLVLDPFGGAGTTAAVAHKMGRRWITIEAGRHARTHIVPRLRAVAAGTDSGGVTTDLGWEGGGDFLGGVLEG